MRARRSTSILTTPTRAHAAQQLHGHVGLDPAPGRHAHGSARPDVPARDDLRSRDDAADRSGRGRPGDRANRDGRRGGVDSRSARPDRQQPDPRQSHESERTAAAEGISRRDEKRRARRQLRRQSRSRKTTIIRATCESISTSTRQHDVRPVQRRARARRWCPAPYGGIIDGSQFGGGDQTVKVYSGALSWTRIYSTSLVSETRFGYSSIESRAAAAERHRQHRCRPVRARRPDPDYPFMGGLPLFTVDGIGQFGVPNNLPSIQFQSTYQISTTFSKLAGNHSWKWGFQFSRPMTEFFQPAAPRGGYGYSGAFTDVPHHDRRRHGHGPDAAEPDRQHADRLTGLQLHGRRRALPGELRGRTELVNVNRIPDPIAARLLAGLVGLHRGHLEDLAEGDGESRTPVRLSAQRRGTGRSRGEPPRGADAALRDGGGSVNRENLSPSFLAQARRRPHRDRMRRQQHARDEPEGHVRAAPRAVVRVRRQLGRTGGRWVVLSDERHVRAERRQQPRPHAADLSATRTASPLPATRRGHPSSTATAAAARSNRAPAPINIDGSNEVQRVQRLARRRSESVEDSR